MVRPIGFLLGLFLLLATRSANAQWHPTPEPQGGIDAYWTVSIRGLALTGAQSGIYTREVNDTAWNLVLTYPYKYFERVGDTLFMLSQNNGLAFVVPGDSLLTLISTGLATSEVTAFQGGSGGTHYATTLKTGFFFSHDHGINWQPSNDGLPADTFWNPWTGFYYFRDLHGLAIVNNHLFTLTNHGVYRCRADHFYWTKDSLMSSKTPSKIFNFKGLTCMTAGDQLYCSPDEGASWQQQTLPPATTRVQTTDTALLAFGNGGLIYISSDTAATWHLLAAYPDSLSINYIGQGQNNSLIISCQEYGNLTFSQGNWGSLNHFINTCTLQRIVETSTCLVAVGNDQLYRSTDGLMWQTITPTFDKSYFGWLAAKGDTLLLSYKRYNTNPYLERDQFVVFSTDQGETWQNFPTLPDYWGDDTYRIIPTKNGLVVYEDDHAFITTDWGTTWLSAIIPQQFCNNFNSICFFNEKLFASACGPAQVLVFNGDEWIATASGLPTDREVTHLFGYKNTLYALVQVHGLFLSNDNGANWQPTASTPPFDWGINQVVTHDKYLVLTSPSGIWISTDQAQHWIDKTDNLPNHYLPDAIFINDSLFVSTAGNGLFYRPISTLPSAIQTPGMEKKRVMSILPNPANERISVATGSREILPYTILNSKGGQVMHGLLQPGETIEVRHLQSGLYFLYFPDRKEAGKFLIIR